MTFEESIIQDLTGKFPDLEGKCTSPRQRRITIEVPKDEFAEVIGYAAKALSFTMLCTITGLDLGDELQAIYHIANEKGVVLNLKRNMPRPEPVIGTVTGIYQGAALYERELKDLLGIRVDGLPTGERYPLPDLWPEDQHPLRKDWKQDMLNQRGGGTVKNE